MKSFLRGFVHILGASAIMVSATAFSQLDADHSVFVDDENRVLYNESYRFFINRDDADSLIDSGGQVLGSGVEISDAEDICEFFSGSQGSSVIESEVVNSSGATGVGNGANDAPEGTVSAFAVVSEGKEYVVSVRDNPSGVRCDVEGENFPAFSISGDASDALIEEGKSSADYGTDAADQNGAGDDGASVVEDTESTEGIESTENTESTEEIDSSLGNGVEDVSGSPYGVEIFHDTERGLIFAQLSNESILYQAMLKAHNVNPDILRKISVTVDMPYRVVSYSGGVLVAEKNYDGTVDRGRMVNQDVVSGSIVNISGSEIIDNQGFAVVAESNPGVTPQAFALYGGIALLVFFVGYILFIIASNHRLRSKMRSPALKYVDDPHAITLDNPNPYPERR